VYGFAAGPSEGYAHHYWSGRAALTPLPGYVDHTYRKKQQGREVFRKCFFALKHSGSEAVPCLFVSENS
jgi:hypothetical protein